MVRLPAAGGPSLSTPVPVPDAKEPGGGLGVVGASPFPSEVGWLEPVACRARLADPGIQLGPRRLAGSADATSRLTRAAGVTGLASAKCRAVRQAGWVAAAENRSIPALRLISSSLSQSASRTARVTPLAFGGEEQNSTSCVLFRPLYIFCSVSGLAGGAAVGTVGTVGTVGAVGAVGAALC